MFRSVANFQGIIASGDGHAVGKRGFCGRFLGEHQLFQSSDILCLRLFYARIQQNPIQHPVADSRLQGTKNGHTVGLFLIGHRFQRRLILPQAQCHSGEILGQAGILFFQQRHHVVPQAVAKKIITGIGAVFNMRDAVLLQKGQHLRTGHPQHRAD